MTAEQEKIFKKGLWDMHLDGYYSEYIAEYFFELGLKAKDKANIHN